MVRGVAVAGGRPGLQRGCRPHGRPQPGGPDLHHGGGQTFRIVGVLASKGTGNGDDIDDKVIIPYTSTQRIAGTKTVNEIWGKAGSAREAELAVVQLGRIFRRKLGLDQSAPTPVPDGGEPGMGVPPGKPMPVMPGGKVFVERGMVRGGETRSETPGGTAGTVLGGALT